MSGIEAIGIIVSAIPIVTRVVKHFGTPRNAPRQVERLSRILAELQDERLVQAAMPEEQKTIANLLNRCTDLFERETTGHKSRTWKFFWSLDAEKQLKEHNDEIELELDRIQRRVHMFAISTTKSPTLLSPARDLQTPSPRLEPRETARVDSAVSSSASPPPQYRRGSVEAVELPTTLCLQNPYGQRIGQRIRLHTLTIIERDDVWRRIQYTGRASGGAQVRITHRIPRGHIWFEDEDLEDLSVSFLEAHDFTIQNAEGYKVYRAYSIYEFGNVGHREDFLVHVRERQLLGRYFAEKIWERGELIAQQKVVRLWKKTASRESQKTTLSFIGRDEKPYERALVDFRRSPTLRGDRVDLVDLVGGATTTIECRPMPKPAKPKRRLFGSRPKTSSSSISEEAGTIQSDAARFKVAFEANHPATSTFSPLTLSPTAAFKMEPDFKSLADTSPCLPELIPSSSRAPTLSTLSFPDASMSFYFEDDLVSPTTAPGKEKNLFGS